MFVFTTFTISFPINHQTEKNLLSDWSRAARFPVNSAQIWNSVQFQGCYWKPSKISPLNSKMATKQSEENELRFPVANDETSIYESK